jgi:hypothetical protein
MVAVVCSISSAGTLVDRLEVLVAKGKLLCSLLWKDIIERVECWEASATAYSRFGSTRMSIHSCSDNLMPSSHCKLGRCAEYQGKSNGVPQIGCRIRFDPFATKKLSSELELLLCQCNLFHRVGLYLGIFSGWARPEKSPMQNSAAQARPGLA